MDYKSQVLQLDLILIGYKLVYRPKVPNLYLVKHQKCKVRISFFDLVEPYSTVLFHLKYNEKSHKESTMLACMSLFPEELYSSTDSLEKNDGTSVLCILLPSRNFRVLQKDSHYLSLVVENWKRL